MGVDVDEAGRHQQPVGIDLAPPPADVPADPHDPPAVHGHIRNPPLCAGTVHYDATANYHIVHDFLSCGRGPRRCPTALHCSPPSPTRPSAHPPSPPLPSPPPPRP